MPRIFDIIQAADQSPDQLVLRVPEQGWGDIRIGSQLVVGESQNAIFFRDGKALDTFGPGHHTLTTANIPLAHQPAGACFQRRIAVQGFGLLRQYGRSARPEWGASEPVALRDEDLGMVRLRAFGTYSIRVADAQRFVAQIVGRARLLQHL